MENWIDVITPTKNNKTPAELFSYQEKPVQIQFDKAKVNKDPRIKTNKNDLIKKNQGLNGAPIVDPKKQEQEKVNSQPIQFHNKNRCEQKIKSSSPDKSDNPQYKPLKALPTQKKLRPVEQKYIVQNPAQQPDSDPASLKKEKPYEKLQFAKKRLNSPTSKKPSINQPFQQNQEIPEVPPRKISFKRQQGANLAEPKLAIRKVQSINLPLIQERQSMQRILPYRSATIDDFYIGKSLWQGYFGQVLLVKDKRTNFCCAMKVIPIRLAKDKEIVDDVVKEIKIGFSLSHPQLLKQYGYFFDDQNLYILQQMVTGKKLSEILEEKVKLDEGQTATIIKQLLDVVEFLHQNSFEYNTITSWNIVMNQNVLKLSVLEWSVSDPKGEKVSGFRELEYSSPEETKKIQYSKSSDIWRIGVLTYQLLTGDTPFNVSSGTKSNINQQQVRFPFYSQISQTAKDFILRMLEKDPCNRWSVEQLKSHPFISKSNGRV